MSSLSYASRLTQGVDYGECGLAEKEDTARVRVREMDKLEKLFRNALYVVMHTGAGVSTCKASRAHGAPPPLTHTQRAVFAIFVAPTACGRARSAAWALICCRATSHLKRRRHR